MRLAGETVVITGAGRGIGEAVAHAFARAGANLVLMARTQSDIDWVAERTASCGVTSLALAGDVSRRADVARVVAAAQSKFGPIDVLVNAAGIYGPIGTFVENDLRAWVEALEVNLLGTVFSMHAVLPGMIARRKGVVVNFSGGGAVAPFPRFSAYSASKAAVVRLTETVAEEVKERGVRVNAIAPGAVNTRLLDQVLEAGERAGEEFHEKAKQQKTDGGTPPALAAELAVFLASPAARFVNGAILAVDGGYLAMGHDRPEGAISYADR